MSAFKDSHKPPLMAMLVGLLLLVSVACGGDDSDSSGTPANQDTTPDVQDTSAEAETPESTVVIDGQAYTCGEITGFTEIDCGPDSQAVFDEYKQNIDTFVNSGMLGPVFNEASYEDTAYAGITACVFAKAGEDENSYIEFMLASPDFSSVRRIDFLPLWFQAQAKLCP